MVHLLLVTHVFAEPVSKSIWNVCGGVPICIAPCQNESCSPVSGSRPTLLGALVGSLVALTLELLRRAKKRRRSRAARSLLLILALRTGTRTGVGPAASTWLTATAARKSFIDGIFVIFYVVLVCVCVGNNY